MQPQCTFSTQYIAAVTSATESQNKTINKGFIESYHHFPPYEEKSSSPADEGENVSHVSETPPQSPSPHTNEAATSEKESAGTKILNLTNLNIKPCIKPLM